MRIEPRAIIAIVVWLALNGCASQRTKAPPVPVLSAQISDRTRMRTALLEAVPLGTSVVDAERFMASERFHCTLNRNASFAEQQDGGHSVVHEGIDYLYCDRFDRAGFMVSRRWQIALVLEDESVKDMIVNAGMIGP